jgi:hypothetical protein
MSRIAFTAVQVEDKSLRDVVFCGLRFLMATYMMALMNDMTEARSTLLPEPSVALPDLFHDLLPYWPELRDFIDTILIVLYVAMLAWAATFPRRFELICAVVDMHVLMMLLRSLCVCMTLLPSSLPNCTHKLVSKPKMLLINPLHRFFSPGGMSAGCHDLIYSGHTVIYTLASLFMHDAAHDHWALRLCTYSLSFAGIFCLLAARIHYSIDVLLAFIIMVLVYIQWRPIVLIHLEDSRHQPLPLPFSFSKRSGSSEDVVRLTRDVEEEAESDM